MSKISQLISNFLRLRIRYSALRVKTVFFIHNRCNCFNCIPVSIRKGHKTATELEFFPIDFPIRLVVTYQYIRVVLVRCNIQRDIVRCVSCIAGHSLSPVTVRSSDSWGAHYSILQFTLTTRLIWYSPWYRRTVNGNDRLIAVGIPTGDQLGFLCHLCLRCFLLSGENDGPATVFCAVASE